MFPNGWNLESNIDFADLGRIVVRWNLNVWDVRVLYKFKQQLSLNCKNKGGLIMVYKAVYGFNTAKARKGLWQDLENISTSVDIPWLVADNFNNIRLREEKAIGIKFLVLFLVPSTMLLKRPTCLKFPTWETAFYLAQ